MNRGYGGGDLELTDVGRAARLSLGVLMALPVLLVASSISMLLFISDRWGHWLGWGGALAAVLAGVVLRFLRRAALISGTSTGLRQFRLAAAVVQLLALALLVVHAYQLAQVRRV